MGVVGVEERFLGRRQLINWPTVGPAHQVLTLQLAHHLKVTDEAVFDRFFGQVVGPAVFVLRFDVGKFCSTAAAVAGQRPGRSGPDQQRLVV